VTDDPYVSVAVEGESDTGMARALLESAGLALSRPRPVKRAIQELVLNELSKQILSGKIDRGHAVKVDFRNEQLVFEN